MKKLAILLVLGILFTSCRSGWSCKKRYVNNKIEQKNNC